MTKSLAYEFRTKGAALARAKTDGYAGVYFGLSTTLATRIRCEVISWTMLVKIFIDNSC
jgi:hypothetical protein